MAWILSLKMKEKIKLSSSQKKITWSIPWGFQCNYVLKYNKYCHIQDFSQCILKQPHVLFQLIFLIRPVFIVEILIFSIF